MRRWEEAGYNDILRVEAMADGRLTVLFADETWSEIDGKRILPPGAAEPRWTEVRVAGNGDYIVIPTAGEPVAVPWDTIRTLTDRDFAEHRIAVAREEARRIGKRIRELREARGLTAKELAEIVGIKPQSISRIELGQHGVTFTTLRQILAAMGYSLKDLILPRPEEHEPEEVDSLASTRRSERR